MATANHFSPNFNFDRILDYLGRPEWREHFEDVMREHLGDAAAVLQVNFTALPAFLGEPWQHIIWIEIFNDIFTRRFGSGKKNVVDAYLASSGKQETPWGKRYLTAVQDSVVGLYQISYCKETKSTSAVDLLRQSGTFEVSLQNIKHYDNIEMIVAGRIIRHKNKNELQGGLLIEENFVDLLLSQYFAKSKIDNSIIGPNDPLISFSPFGTYFWIVNTYKNEKNKCFS